MIVKVFAETLKSAPRVRLPTALPELLKEILILPLAKAFCSVVTLILETIESIFPMICPKEYVAVSLPVVMVISVGSINQIPSLPGLTEPNTFNF